MSKPNTPSDVPIAVTSRSFSRSAVLREKLEAKYSNVAYNNTDHSLVGDELVTFLQGKKKAIIALEKMTAEVFAQLPDLEVIGKYGVGVNNLDLEAMEKHQVKLGWTPGVNARSVSELVLCHLLGFSRNIHRSARKMLKGEWKVEGGMTLTGKTVGIIGCGCVGKDLIQLLKPFGCKLLVHDIRDYPDFYQAHGVETVSKATLLAQADFVTLHIPYNSSTVDFIASDELALMQSHATLINTSRGGIVNEAALLTWLQQNPDANAALDVFADEPFLTSPLLQLDNFYATPHIGGSAKEAISAMGEAAIAGLDNASDDIAAIRALVD